MPLSDLVTELAPDAAQRLNGPCYDSIEPCLNQEAAAGGDKVTGNDGP